MPESSPESFFDFRQRIASPRAGKTSGRGAPAAPASGTAARGFADNNLADSSTQSPASTAKRRTAAADADAALSVADLTGLIDAALRKLLPASLLVRGEISNLSHHRASGHYYFTLKDDRAAIDCVMFKSDAARLRFDPADGAEVLLGGSVRVYMQRGRYQFYATTMLPIGTGALELAFGQLRDKLGLEGLFDPGRKRGIPAYPLRVGIVTSPQAAALADVLKVLQRYPFLRLMLYPTPVQGAAAAEAIAAALRAASAEPAARRADVVLLGRGGGSLEDLWAFNEEAVARAVAACGVPVVTGIGHEVDTSIADLVADYHAHTPTEAAQVIVARWRLAADAVDESARRLARAVRQTLTDAHQRLTAVERHEFFRRPMDQIDRLRERLDDQQRRLDQHAAGRIAVIDRRLIALAGRLQAHHPAARLTLARQQTDHLEADFRRSAATALTRRSFAVDALDRQLASLNPANVVARGYSITRLPNGQIVKSISDVKTGERITTQLPDGQIESRTLDARQPELF